MPLKQVNVTPKVGGKVKSVLAEVGMAGVRGAGALRARRLGLRGAVPAGRRRPRQRRRPRSPGPATPALEQQKVQAKSALDQAQVAYDEAKSAYDRTKLLYDAGSVAKQQLEDVDAHFKAAGIQRDAAASALSLV